MTESSERIKALLFTLGDVNLPDWKEAFSALFQEESTNVLPILIQSFWDRGITDPNWEGNLENWCMMLCHAQLTLPNPNIVDLCVPTLVGLLYIQQNYRFDPYMVLSVFELLDVTRYPYIIPALIQTIRQKWILDAFTTAWKLLSTFSEEELRPYQDILLSLKKI